MKFEFATAGRILFGSGGFGQLPSLAQGLGDAALLVLGRSRRHGEALSAGLAGLGVRSWIFSVTAEPTVHLDLDVDYEHDRPRVRTGQRMSIIMAEFTCNASA